MQQQKGCGVRKKKQPELHGKYVDHCLERENDGVGVILVAKFCQNAGTL